MKRHYRIKGTLWKQGVLLYPQAEATKDIIKGAFELVKSDESSLWKIIDELITQKVAPRIVAIVLTPYQPTFLHQLWNEWMFKRHGRPENIVEWMTLEQVGQVLFDFFTINFAWIANALPTQMRFDSIFQAMTNARTSTPTRSSTPSPEETSSAGTS